MPEGWDRGICFESTDFIPGMSSKLPSVRACARVVMHCAVRVAALFVLVSSVTALNVGPMMTLGAKTPKRLLVIGGNGFVRHTAHRMHATTLTAVSHMQVGREVCKYAVQTGFKVTSMSRRGECPLPDDEWLSQVETPTSSCRATMPHMHLPCAPGGMEVG